MKGSRGLILVLVFFLVMAATWFVPAEALDAWTDEFFRWPWKSGTSHSLSVLPGEEPHHSESTSAEYAIDASMAEGTKVYSVASGTVDRVASDGLAGYYVRVQNADSISSYTTYEHLLDQSAEVAQGAAVVAGQPIASSGCSGNCSGDHLHFQRQSGSSFSSDPLRITPISGVSSLSHTSYQSDNAGVGYSSTDVGHSGFAALYNSLGRYSGVGATANIGLGWTPCRAILSDGIRWRKSCSPRSGISGSFQAFRVSSSEKRRAVMANSSTAYLLGQGILGVYTDLFTSGGVTWDFVYWIGYPTGNRFSISGGFQQNFQAGFIRYFPNYPSPGQCLDSVYMDDPPRVVYSATYCD